MNSQEIATFSALIFAILAILIIGPIAMLIIIGNNNMIERISDQTKECQALGMQRYEPLSTYDIGVCYKIANGTLETYYLSQS
jgi:hypothetical protein